MPEMSVNKSMMIVMIEESSVIDASRLVKTSTIVVQSMIRSLSCCFGKFPLFGNGCSIAEGQA